MSRLRELYAQKAAPAWSRLVATHAAERGGQRLCLRIHQPWSGFFPSCRRETSWWQIR